MISWIRLMKWEAKRSQLLRLCFLKIRKKRNQRSKYSSNLQKSRRFQKNYILKLKIKSLWRKIRRKKIRQIHTQLWTIDQLENCFCLRPIKQSWLTINHFHQIFLNLLKKSLSQSKGIHLSLVKSRPTRKLTKTNFLMILKLASLWPPQRPIPSIHYLKSYQLGTKIQRLRNVQSQQVQKKLDLKARVNKSRNRGQKRTPSSQRTNRDQTLPSQDQTPNRRRSQTLYLTVQIFRVPKAR